ncbi:MAG TPA: DNA topoisomerase VI subunit B [Candidatus Nanoarchaeia archaeon]|nr:DNA topoisomerase VI subunit B [Candidatus Nanoarchaeia archaeon]
MPMLIREDGKIRIVKIGEFINKKIETKKNNVTSMRDGQLERLSLHEFIETLSFDKKTQKLGFHRVSTLFRHKVNSKIYRVKLTSGRYVDLTAYHSVFTLNKGTVIPMATSELKVGMPIIVPRKSWTNYVPIQEINLIDELLSLDPSLTSKFNVYGVNSVLSDSVVREIRTILPRSFWYRTNDFKRFNYLPFNILRKLHLDITKLNDSKLGASLSRYKIPAVIKVNHNFAELLGLYIAEGSVLKTLTRMHFSFGSQETELIRYLSDIFEKIFDFKPKIQKAHKSAYNVIANSTILCFVFKHIFGVGESARTKRIPSIVFDFSNDLKHSFLVAYLTGDGYPTKELFEVLKNDLTLHDVPAEKITCATSSFELFNELQYLLSSLGVNYSVGFSKSEKRLINGVTGYFGESYYLYIYSANKKSAINFLPIEHSIIRTTDPKIRYAISRSNQINLHRDTLSESSSIVLYDELETFLSGDLGVLRITEITEIEYHDDWVYDVSVPLCENFVAGVGAIVCHNSLDACEDAAILPDVSVEVVDMGNERFRVIVEDNGPGIVKKQIPNIFAKLLYGSKFHTFRQQRGQQGIGISAAVLYAQLTTGKPARITSKTDKDKPAHYFELHIDTQKNEPEIVVDKEVEWAAEHGTRIELDLEASYQKGDQSVDQYLKATAIVNPHAQIVYVNPKAEQIVFARAADKLPLQAKEIKPHPYGVELGTILKMLKSTDARTLQSFLMNEFSRVGSGTVKEICQNAALLPSMKTDDIQLHHIEQLVEGIKKTKIIAPPTDCIVPIGAQLLEQGLRKEVTAEFYTSVTRAPEIYRGIPFCIEIAVAYGGTQPADQPSTLLRFANRVPLLYQQSACAVYKSIIQTNWRAYGLQQSQGSLPIGPLTVAIHLASVWPPFTSEAKEAIAHYPEIIKEMKLALQECGRKLGMYVRKKLRVGQQRERANIFEKYIPEVADSIAHLSGESKEVLLECLKKMIKKPEILQQLEIPQQEEDQKKIKLTAVVEDEENTE